MLLYLLFCTILGFIFHFYIIFGTNLLTEAQPRIAIFCLFQCFEETEYQTESKRNETFGNVIFSPNVIQETWTLLQGTREVVTRVGAPPGCAPGPYLVGSLLLHRCTPSSYIYLRIPKRSKQEPKT